MLIAGIDPLLFAGAFLLMTIVVLLCCFFLKEKHTDLLREGRAALSDYQESMSEGSHTGSQKGACKQKIKKKFKEGTEQKKENRRKEEKKRSSNEDTVPSAPPLHPVLEEFANLELTDFKKEDDLSDQDWGDLEEETARYESEEEGPYGYAGLSGKSKAPDRSRLSSLPPPYGPPTGGCHFINRRTWSRLAAAYPVFQDPNNNNARYYEPIPYKQLKDLVEAAKTYGANAAYTQTLLQRFTGQAMTPSDWWEIARACLSTGQYLDYRSIVVDAAHVQARINAQHQGRAPWNADMLLGQGNWAANQTAYPLEVYQQINEIYLKAWKTLPKRGEVSGNLTKIVQGANEPFSDFVARMIEAAGKIFGDAETSMPLVQQLVYEQATRECRRAITPWKNKGIEAWLKACREIGGPLTNAGLTAAMVAAMKTNGAKGKGCFNCGQMGHIKRQCPRTNNENRPQNRQPGTCPRCKKGKHWANECRSVRDINGQPIPPNLQQQQSQSKNGLRGPRLQGPKIFGAMQEPSMRPPRPSGEQPQALEGWTSVPPPDWY